jgi:hypothetical protein
VVGTRQAAGKVVDLFPGQVPVIRDLGDGAVAPRQAPAIEIVQVVGPSRAGVEEVTRPAVVVDVAEELKVLPVALKK